MSIQSIKQRGILWIKNMLRNDIIYSKPGSISYLIYGKKPSEQSINIKLGRFGEFLTKEIIRTNNDFELLECGIQKINDHNKDIDLLFRDQKKKIIYYRELKANIQLDTEKYHATICKCKEIMVSLQSRYTDYQINYGIFHWSIYNKNILLSNVLHMIKKFEQDDIHIDHFEDFMNIISMEWSEDDYYSYFYEIGRIITEFKTLNYY